MKKLTWPLLAIFLIISLSNLTFAQTALTPNILQLDDPANMPEATVDDLAWFSGRWLGEGFGGIIEENWNPPLGEAMVATFRLIKDDQPQFYEICMLEPKDHSVVYKVKHFNPGLISWEDKEEYISFPLVKLEPNAAYFDGLTMKLQGNTMHLYLAMEQDDGSHSEIPLVYHRVSPSTTPESQTIEGVSLERLDRYRQFIQKEVDEGNIPGAVTLVARHGQIIHHAAHGHRNLAEEEAMDKDDLFYIQSMTKPIITVAFMMLYEEGHFLLTDPVSKYLPAFKELRVAKDVNAGKDGETETLKRPITMAHLLSHTAGLSHGLGGTQLDREVYQNQYLTQHATIQDRLNSLLKLPLIGQPGQQWYYSAAPDVLSVLIEHFSGIPTNEFLQERIFKPLEMNDTGYNLPAEKYSRVVKLHQKNEAGELVLAERQEQPAGNTVWSGVNALFSTVPDYLNFCQMLLNGGEWRGRRLLSRKTIELMTENHTGDLFGAPGKGFGLGFAVIDDLAGGKLLGSEGLFHWSGAFNTHFFIDPEEQLIGLFMTQTAPYTDYYHEKLRQLVYQAIVD